ncbi:MAG: Rho termination factor N-terminal domain-containing protein, partial [Aeromicrobium sp.]
MTDTSTQPPAAEQPNTAQSSAAEQPEQAAPKSDTASAPRRSTGGLGGKVLAELQEIAGGLDISGASKMRKGELIDAIKAAQGEATTKSKSSSADSAKESKADQDDKASAPDVDEKSTSKRDDAKDEPKKDDGPKDDQKNDGGRNRNQGGGGNRNQGGGGRNQDRNQGGNQGNQGGQGGANQGGGNRDDDDFGGGGGRRRNRRGRNRGNRGPEGEPTYSEDDVLVPAAGILDILDNYAFVRTTGYLPSENDVYVSLSMVRKWGLRKGDAVVGQVRQPREGERKEKFNPMVRVDSVNGMTIDEAKKRVEFSKLTP